jgi:dTDP-4-dehydrorhamnose 3,5-epimerase
MPVEIKKCPIDGLVEIQPKIFNDGRGYFFESYSKKDCAEAGITVEFVQDNQSFSTKGVLRGLHFQKEHPQAKLVRVIKGKVFDVAVDIRKNSPSFGKWYGVVLDGEKQNQFFIPADFAHGFLVLSDECVFSYKCSDFYFPADQHGIIYDDPQIGISWPNIGMDYILADKDKQHPLLKNL